MSKLLAILNTTIPGLDYELVDVIVSPAKLVTVFIDKPGGITIDDCEKVSNHLLRLFAVEEIDFNRLEVSSPGLERPLKTIADFAKYKGKLAKIKVNQAIDRLKVFQGIIHEVNEHHVILALDEVGTQLSIDFSNIDRARLIYELVKGK